MSIPLIWFLFAWLAFVALFAFLAFLTVAMTLRFGLSCTSTYIYSGGFLLVSAVIILMTSAYLMSIDWSQQLVLFGNVFSSY